MNRCLKWMVAFLALVFLQSITAVAALPVQYNYFDIVSSTSEDFEGYAYTDVGLSEPFDGFVASTATYPLVIEQHSTLCGSNGDTCLYSGTISNEIRSISDFSAGTIVAGLDLHKVSPSDVFSITVIGGSGNRTFISSNSGYIAFADRMGLLQIDFLNLGSQASEGNYSFDEVITGVSVIPLPPAFAVFGAALLMLCCSGRFWKRC